MSQTAGMTAFHDSRPAGSLTTSPPFQGGSATRRTASPHPITEPHAAVSLSVSDFVVEPAPIRHTITPSSPATGKRKGKERAGPISDMNGEEVEVDQREDSGPFGTDDEDEDDADYEAIRSRQIQENQRLLASLGIHASVLGNDPSSSSSSLPEASSSFRPAHLRVRRRKKTHEVTVYDRSGHIISLPAEGRTHTMACVEMPSDRKLRKQIVDGEYQDCSGWREGEARRWRFGFGRGGELGEGEEESVGGVGKDFRWRRWRGLHKELRSEMKKLEGFVERETRPKSQVLALPEGVSAYSLIPGEPCHQCRRKSEKPKMKCRNIDPICRASFCETCCKRYSYFEFDEDSRSFICPLCRDCCNCSQCIRKRNLVHLLGTTTSKEGFRKQSAKKRMKEFGTRPDGMTVQAWLEIAAGKDEEVKAPFDRVRIVDQATDIISPDLPEEEMEVIVVKQAQNKVAKKRKHALIETVGEGPVTGEVVKPKSRRGRKKIIIEGVPDKQGVGEEIADKKKKVQGSLVVKLKLPNTTEQVRSTPPSERVKEVDSDGDTVGDWSSDDGRAKRSDSDSALTPLSSEGAPSPPVPARLPFPPRQSAVPSTQNTAELSGANVPPEPQTEMLVERDGPGGSNDPINRIHSEHNCESPNYAPELLPQINISPSTNANPIDSAPGGINGERRRRRRPPPKANIVRQPKRNSIPNTTPPVVSSTLAPSNLFNEPVPFNEAFNSLSPSAIPMIPTIGPTLSAPLWDNTPQSHFSGGYPTLIPYPQIQSDFDSQYSHLSTVSNGYATNQDPVLPSMTLPSHIPIEMLHIPQPLSFRPHPSSNLPRHEYVSHPPPYSHSPTKRPLTFEPPHALSHSNDFDDLHQSTTSSFDLQPQPRLQNLDLLSLAAAEARQSPGFDQLGPNTTFGCHPGGDQSRDEAKVEGQRFWHLDEDGR